MLDALHRIASGAPITPRQLRWAGIVAIEWWLMDHLWMLATLNHWFGL